MSRGTAGGALTRGQSVRACLRQQPHTEVEVAFFAASHIAPSATVVSDGLWCFGATTIVGAEHERHVTGGGKASVKLPQFKAIDQEVMHQIMGTCM